MPRNLAPGIVACVALAFAVATTAHSALRWANFGYDTFDLAFYVQGLWLFLHGKFHVSLLNVPILGNHVEPIVFALAPVFAIFQHPMTLVALQNAALAAMAPIGYAICRRLGLTPAASAMLGSATLLAPAAGFIALHEFHPEAFSAPLLLLMFHARLRGSLAWFWVGFVAVLSCKENMALLLVAYGLVQAAADWRNGWRNVFRWDLAPTLAAIGWLAICGTIITPLLNQGHVEYVALYAHLGESAPVIVRNFFTEPQRALDALGASLRGGNLVWALLLPFALLPLLRARWLVVAAPILLQHLLSWRSSEWMIYFHYAAPVLPLFWIASAEAVAWFHQREKLGKMSARFVSPARSLPVLVLIGCAIGQALIGPIGWRSTGGLADTETARAVIAQVPAGASVVAPLPYLSHLAMREELFSLHHILKGLKTLSRSEYVPPPPADFVIIDAADGATFDPGAGYFHPQMRMLGGKIIPSSERLLHDYLAQTMWLGDLRNSVAVYRRGIQANAAAHVPEGVEITPGTFLVSANARRENHALTVQLAWRSSGPRGIIPWLELDGAYADQTPLPKIAKGLCAPDATEEHGTVIETWHVTLPSPAPPGEMRLRLAFYDGSSRAWLPEARTPLHVTALTATP